MDSLTRRSFVYAAAGSALLPQAAQPANTRRPNILFAIADDWGYGHAGAYGCKWVNTPAFDRIAREGALFRNAFTSNPKCSPSRASILTGRNTWQLKEAVDHYSIFPNGFATYPAELERAGYVTGMTGKGWAPGNFVATGFKHNPAGIEYQKITLKPPTTGISKIDYAGNFQSFLEQKPQQSPFVFWLGSHEPHRPYEDGSGLRAGKKLADVTLPPYYPDSKIIRSDFLDYALEVEWFDSHVARCLRLLERRGELDNTLVVFTSDNGEPFPRVKGQIYEAGFHLPLAIRWGKNMQPGRVIDDFINFRDFAPTFLQAAGLEPAGTMTGKSFLDVLQSKNAGVVDRSRNSMIIGKERHDIGRPHDWGYPVRAIRTAEFLYIRNYEPDRWPAGNPETGYTNVDDSPTKTLIISAFDEYFRLSFGKRPPEELYDIAKDPDCLHNLAADADFTERKRKLRERMEETLRGEGDPRMLGRADFFDTIEYFGPKKHSYDEWLKFSRAK
jgi:N-sulfoglucosamine sulfohydrolase